MWNIFSGFCFIIFTEYFSGVIGVIFIVIGYVIVIFFMDGIVRVFDFYR